jgi:hypothetical protein
MEKKDLINEKAIKNQILKSINIMLENNDLLDVLDLSDITFALNNMS